MISLQNPPRPQGSVSEIPHGTSCSWPSIALRQDSVQYPWGSGKRPRSTTWIWCLTAQQLSYQWICRNMDCLLRKCRENEVQRNLRDQQFSKLSGCFSVSCLPICEGDHVFQPYPDHHLGVSHQNHQNHGEDRQILRQGKGKRLSIIWVKCFKSDTPTGSFTSTRSLVKLLLLCQFGH